VTNPSGIKHAPGKPRPDWQVLALGAAVSAAAAAAYSGTFSVPLIFDDHPSILFNTSLRHLGTALRPPIDATVGGRPVLNLSFAANYAASGLSVWSYHAANLAIHILAGLTLLGIVRRTLARRGERAGDLVAFSAALIWTLHPLQTGAVTYLVQRAESLMGLFYLLTLYFFIRGAEGAGPWVRAWFALSVGACLLGMATKEVMASAPLVVLLYDRTFLAGSFSAAWRRRWPVYAGLASSWLVLALLVVSSRGRGGTAGAGSGVSPLSYAFTQTTAIILYLRLCFLPYPQVFDYGSALQLHASRIAPCALAVAGLLLATARGLARGTAIGFLGASFFAILAPSSSFIPVATETMAEHRMYLALAPVVVLGVVGLYRWLGLSALPVCLALAAALAAVTWTRNLAYRSEEAIWRDTVAKLPDNERARNNLGVALSGIPGRLDEAIAQYEEAVRLKPGYAEAHCNLGNALSAEGRTREAIAQYEDALRLEPGLVEAHCDLGLVLQAIPARLNEAIGHFGEALRLRPGYAEAHFGMGSALERIPGRLDDAVAQLREALRIRPDYAEAHNNLGIALSLMPGRSSEAVAQFEEALKSKPAYPDAQFNLGFALETMPGRLADAVGHYEEAVRLRPDYAEARSNLGNALNSMGRSGEAIAQYGEALRLRPDDARIHLGLAIALLKVGGRSDEAAAQLREALRLEPGNEMARGLLAQMAMIHE
jgi:tetratricopeptide (TPR) repeat protein